MEYTENGYKVVARVYDESKYSKWMLLACTWWPVLAFTSIGLLVPDVSIGGMSIAASAVLIIPYFITIGIVAKKVNEAKASGELTTNEEVEFVAKGNKLIVYINNRKKKGMQVIYDKDKKEIRVLTGFTGMVTVVNPACDELKKYFRDMGVKYVVHSEAILADEKSIEDEEDEWIG